MPKAKKKKKQKKQMKPSISMLKRAFADSLKKHGMSVKQFDNIPKMKDKADVILQMSKDGILNLSHPDPAISHPMRTCLATFVREGYDFNDACKICDGLRAAYSSPEDLVIEAISNLIAAVLIWQNTSKVTRRQ